MPRLRVCLATDCYPPGIGGIENHVYCLASGLARAGHTVDVLTHRAIGSPSRSPFEMEPDPGGFRVLRLGGLVLNCGGADPMADPRVFSRVARILRENTYDVVHGHSFESLLVLAALRAARRLRTPALLTKHSMTVRSSRPAFFNRLAQAAEQLAARRLTQGLIVLSEAGVAEMDGAGVPVHRLHGGVDQERWRPDPEAGAAIRASLGWGPDDRVVGYLGRLVGSKGVRDLVEVVSPLMARDARVRLLIVGDGPLRPELARRLQELGVAERAHLAGAVAWRETPAWFSAMDIFAFPSHTEAFGLVVLEAAACGVPTVARRNAGTQETIRPGETGVLVNDAAEMGSQVEMLLEDEARRRRLGRQARRMAEGEFSWQTVAAATARLYQEVLNAAQAAASGTTRGGGGRASTEVRTDT